MSGTTPRILVFVEDPGAANMVLGLAEELTAVGSDVQISASGHAADYLRTRKVPVTDCRTRMDAIEAMNDQNPNVVVVGTSENPMTPAFTMVAEARRQGIPTVALIDGPANAAQRLRGTADDPLAHAPDWLLVCDGQTKTAYEQLGVDPNRIIITGHPGMDRVRDIGAQLNSEGRDAVRRRCFPNAPANRPILVFLVERSDGLDGVQFQRGPDYTLIGRGDADGRTEIVLEEVLDAAQTLAPAPYVVVRLHPKTPRQDYAAYAPEIDAWSEEDDPLPPLFAADAVVGLSTVLLFEAALLGRDVLSVLPREEEMGWLASNALGLTPYVTNRKDLRRQLGEALNPANEFMPEWPANAIVFGAAERIAVALNDIAQGKTP